MKKEMKKNDNQIQRGKVYKVDVEPNSHTCLNN